MDNQLAATNQLVYGTPQDELLFIPRERAAQLAAINQALNTAATWGEFFRLLPEAARAELEEFFDEEGEDRPPDERPFDQDDVPGVADGDWPGWPAKEMLSWVPKDVQQRYGRVAESAISGECLELDTSHTAAIVTALEAHGYTCTRDDNLVALAAGHV